MIHVDRRLAWIACLGMLLVSAEKVSADSIRHDFRAKHHNEQLFRFTGPNATDLVKAEEEGLRITFEEGKAPTQPVGVYWPHFIVGDFRATVRYEILKIGPVSKGVGVGVEVYLMLDGPTKDGLFVAHIRSSTNGPVTIRGGHMTNDETGKRIAKYVKKFHPETGHLRGRLRVEREKSNLTVSIAPDDAEEFKSLYSTEMGDADVRMLRFAGITGGEPNAVVDARLIEFEIEGKKLGHEGRVRVASKDKAPPKVGEEPRNEVPSRPTNYIYIIVFAAFGLFLVAVLGLGFYIQRKTRNALLASHARRTNTPHGGSADSIAFTCECGKTGRVQRELAGKRIKCPTCGKPIQIEDQQ